MKTKRKKILCDLLVLLRYCLPFFILLITSFFVIIPRVRAADDSYKPFTLTIRGKVPLSPQFAYAMSKNSQAESNTFSPSVNDMVFIKLHLLGANDIPLPNQTIVMRMSNSVKQKVYEETIKTNETGLAVFHFCVAENMSGNMQVEFTNLTYAEPIRLKTTLAFTVQNNQNVYKEWTIDIYEQGSSLISNESFSFTGKIGYIEIVTPLFVSVEVLNEKNNLSIIGNIYYSARAGPLFDT